LNVLVLKARRESDEDDDDNDDEDVVKSGLFLAEESFLLFKDGEKVAEVVGANEHALLSAIQKNM